MALVRFSNADVKIRIGEKRRLKSFVEHICISEQRELEFLSVVFCSDDYLLALNKKFLNHDFYTDILTFDLSEGEAIAGEIYISTDRVRENSRFNSVSFVMEVHRILFHGVLHLCGFGDKTMVEKDFMSKKEDEYLATYSTFHVKQ